MRWALIASLGCLLPISAWANDDTFPYTAFAKTDDVEVHSGPGDGYYSTAKLKAGQKVEVYRHDPGGWDAIRPPEGSFSWIEGRYLQVGKDGLARVTGDQVPAHVGSRLHDARGVIRVWLHRGEVVELLDSKTPKDFPAKDGWCKIAPPAGEFRWVDVRSLDTSTPGSLSRTGGSEENAPAAAAGEPAASVLNHGLSAAQFDAALRDVNLELSMMVIADPGAWYLGELRRRTQGLFDQTQTAAQRSRTRLLLGKIAWFEEIQQRARRAAQGPAAEGAQRGPGGSVAPNDSRFDAQGQLVRVQAVERDGPQYAILDAEGHIRCYVSPAPGVNLQSFVGRVVGVNGILGYMPQQRASHVVARHVSPVDGTLGGTMLR